MDNFDSCVARVPLTATFDGIPKDTQRIIQTYALSNLSGHNMSITFQNISDFALINKSFHTFLNEPKNLKKLILYVTDHFFYNEISLSQKLKNMPGIQNIHMQEWLKQRQKEIFFEEQLCKAASLGDLKTVKKLLAQGVHINARNTLGNNALLNASFNPLNHELIQELIAKGADVNIANKHGETPLMIASLQKGNLPIVQKLLRAGADINAQNNSGSTALNYAINSRHPAIVKELLHAHPDLTRVSNKRMPLLQWAKKFKNGNKK